MSAMRGRKKQNSVPVEPEEIIVTGQPDVEVHESSEPMQRILADANETVKADEVVEKINSGRICFLLKEQPHSIRVPKGHEQLLSQQIYSKEFFRLVKEGIPSVSQVNVRDFLPEELVADYNRKVARIEKGYYEPELWDKEDFELPDPAPITPNQVAAAKLRLALDMMTVTPGTIMLLQNTAETLAQQKQNLYLTWVGFEKEENGQWVRAVPTFEEFLELPDSIISFLIRKRAELTQEDFDFLSG